VNTRSPVAQSIAHLPKGTLIVSNDPSAVYRLAHRTSYILPSSRLYLTHQNNPDYAREMQQWVRLLGQRGAYGYFHPNEQIWTANADTLRPYLRVDLVAKDGDDELYQISSQG
jgi:hypothetical protein